MHAIFVSHGPFASHLKTLQKRQAQIQTENISHFNNVELYGLVVRLLDIPSSSWAPTNGTSLWDDYVKWNEL
jgi:hypothetical protein